MSGEDEISFCLEIGSQGRITVPEVVRKALDLECGDLCKFKIELIKRKAR